MFRSVMEEITAEYAVEHLAPSTPYRVRTSVTVATKSDLGRVREHNEDKVEFFLNEEPATVASRGSVFVVCDGMGGHSAGQIASELATKTFIDVYLNHPAHDPTVAAHAAAVAANRFVYDVGRAVEGRKGMGTTLSAVLIVQDQAICVQIGDSRIYRMREGVLEQLSEDQTWVEMALKAGMIRPEEADTHPYRHMLLRAIGAEPSVEPEVWTMPLQVGDTFFVCSDGVINHVSNDALAVILRESTPSVAAWRAVNDALAGGGSDNATALVLRIDALEPVSPSDTEKL
jgi:serine/threonine protein phosphatase PrpC